MNWRRLGGLAGFALFVGIQQVLCNYAGPWRVLLAAISGACLLMALIWFREQR